MRNSDITQNSDRVAGKFRSCLLDPDWTHLMNESEGTAL
jgi:hypothetical protein